MKLEFSRQIFKKYPNIKFHENPPWSQVVPRGHDEANSRSFFTVLQTRKKPSITSPLQPSPATHIVLLQQDMCSPTDHALHFLNTHRIYSHQPHKTKWFATPCT
jgi:hypothetical protein